jgi:3-oxoacyl-[acyl-carrier protein] reductase
MVGSDEQPDAFRRVALVTGAARGIGQALAVGLARAGVTVAAVDVLDCSDTVNAIETAGGVGRAFQADVSQTADVSGLRTAIEAHLGQCGILVNNAAIGGRVPFLELERARFRRLIEVNLEGPFVVCREFVPRMVEHGWGRVINIASTSLYTNTPELSGYMATKGGLLGLTYGMANDLGPLGVTVNAVSPPALTVTPMFEERLAEGKLSEEELARVIDNQAVKQRGSPEDIVGVVVYLASEASAMATGQFIRVDGGMTRS